jgi:hypothetical protein
MFGGGVDNAIKKSKNGNKLYSKIKFCLNIWRSYKLLGHPFKKVDCFLSYFDEKLYGVLVDIV